MALYRAGVPVVLNDDAFPMADSRCNGAPKEKFVSSINKTWCHVPHGNETAFRQSLNG